MKPKKVKQSELVDALKHLKITDRRLRTSFRGSTIHTLTLFGDSSNRRSRFHLTRSASTSSLAYDVKCCSACEYCSALNAANQLAFEPLNPLPVFNHENRVPNSHCVTGKYCEDRLSQNLQLLLMRRAYGTEISPINCDKTHFVSIAQTPSDINNTRPCDERLICCCNHDAGNNLIHSRLYRRLYSLIDHPCVSFHYPCRRHTCTHTTLPGSNCMGNLPFRYSSLRHRRTLAPTLAYKRNTSSCSKSPETESDLGVGDFTSFSQEKVFKLSELSLDSSNITQYSSIYHPSPMYTSEYSSVNNPSRSQLYNKCNSIINHNDDQDVNNQRCRRNSDPEQWQQIRTTQTEKLSQFSVFLKDTNETLNLDRHDVGSPFYKNSFTELENTSLNLSGELKSKPTKCDVSGLTISTSTTLNESLRSNLAVSDVSSRMKSPYSLNFNKSLLSNPNQCPSFIPIICSQLFSFRSSVLDSNQLIQSTVGDQTTTPTSTTKSTYSEMVFSSNLSGDCNTPDNDLTPILSRSQSSNPDMFSGNNSLLWSGVANSQNDKLTAYLNSQSDNQTYTNHLGNSNTNNLSDDLVSHMSNISAQNSNNTDVSVNELASYMEHIVHIPGRMSEMAQRMYL